MIKFLTVLDTFFLVIFSSISLVLAPINVGGKETVYENKLNNILLNITNKYFAPGQFIHIVMSEDYSLSLSWFWEDLFKNNLFEKWSIVITYPHKQQVNGFTAKLPDVVVILFDSYQGLIQLCNILGNASESWNPAAKFLLITSINNTHSKPTKVKEFAMSIFNYLWTRNEIRVSLVVLNDSSKSASLFSASPYSTFYKTCKKIDNISQLQEINLVNNKTNLTKIAGYQFETPNSFFGCSFIGHTFPFPPYSVADTSSSNGCRVYNSGIEVQLLKLMGGVYNLSLEILTSPNYGIGNEWLIRYPNGTRTGMLEELRQNNIDLAFAGVIPASSIYFNLSLSNTYIDSSLSWYVPGAQIIPIWKLVLNTFSGVTWLFMLSLLFLVTMLYYTMNGFQRVKDEEPVDLTMLALSLGFSIQWTRRSRPRILLLAWSLFCFHIALMFNTRLFSVLTGHPFDLGIETVQQLHDSKFKTCTFGSYKRFYVNQTDGIMRDLIKHAHDCDILDESVKVLMKYKNFSILAKDDHMSLKIDNKIQNIHRLKDSKFINYPVVIPLAKGSPFLGVLNRLIFNITESGLIFKWLSDVRRNLKNDLISREKHDGTNYLVTEDLIWLYFLFLVGQGVAFLVLLIEIYVKSVR